MENLGKKAKDMVSGMEGTLTSKVVYLNGCTQYGLTPAWKGGDSKYPESTWIDEGQLEILPTDQVIPKSNLGNMDPGGPQTHLPKQ